MSKVTFVMLMIVTVLGGTALHHCHVEQDAVRAEVLRMNEECELVLNGSKGNDDRYMSELSIIKRELSDMRQKFGQVDDLGRKIAGKELLDDQKISRMKEELEGFVRREMSVNVMRMNMTEPQPRARDSRHSAVYSIRKEPSEEPLSLDREKAEVRSSAEIKKLLEGKRKEHQNLRKINPACVLKTDRRNIRNIDYRLPGREEKRYYQCKNVTHVRDLFYCTKCKQDFTDHYCNASKASAPIWRAARDKVDETLEINSKIDAVLNEIDELEKELSQAIDRERKNRNKAK